MVNYTDADKAAIKANPLNRENCKWLPETVAQLADKLRVADMQPAFTAKERKEKASRVADARQAWEERRNVLNLYKEIFPDLFQGK